MSPIDDREMGFAGLVERLVPMVAELFATLATQDPLRMYFADIANKTLLDIVDVLRGDGISQEAIAASLGLTIGGFRSKLKKLRAAYRETDGEDAGDAGPRTLLESVYSFIDQGGTDPRRPTTYAMIATRFKHLKEDSVKGVLHFLVQYGLLSVSGRGENRVYRVVERPSVQGATWLDASVMLFRHGPLSLELLAARLGEPEELCVALLDELDDRDVLEEVDGDDGIELYRVKSFTIPVGTAQGYEAALLDHVGAVLRAICKKVRLGRHSAQYADKIGGTTHSFDVPAGHPLEDEIAGFLAETRVKMDGWLTQVRGIEEDDEQPKRRITIYTGQMVEEL